MRVAARIDGTVLFWNGDAWDVESNAQEMSKPDAERRLRINNANNRFLDPEDHIEAYIVESK